MPAVIGKPPLVSDFFCQLRLAVLVAMPVCLGRSQGSPHAKAHRLLSPVSHQRKYCAPQGDKPKLKYPQGHCLCITSNRLQNRCRAARCGPLPDLPSPSSISLQRLAWPSTCRPGSASPPALTSSQAAVLAPRTHNPSPAARRPAADCLQAGRARHPQCPCALHHKLLRWTCLTMSLLPTACHRGPPGAGHLPGGRPRGVACQAVGLC